METPAIESKMEHPKEMEMEKLEEETKTEEQRPSSSRRKRGGLITMPFIIVNESFAMMASYGLSSNMILYFMNDYHIGVAKGNNILFLFSAATNFFPLIGAFVADSYLGRFLTIGLGSIFSLLGMVILWLTAMIPQVRPPHCNQFKETCKSATGTQFAILLSSFVLMAIGAGGVRPCSLAFGADQLDKRTSTKGGNNRVLEKFFTWYYASYAVSILLAITVIVYIQDHAGWKVGFAIPAILMFLSTIVFFLASRFYIMHKPTTSLITSFSQVIVVAYKNRKLSFPYESHDGVYHHKKDSNLTKPTDKIRCLNKACIIRNPEDISPDGSTSNPWRVCTVDQVEELKSIIKVMPLWSTGIVMSLNLSQGAFGLLQARSMNRHITSGFEYPAGSFGFFTIVGAACWIVIYDRILLPLASKIRGKPVQIGLKVRMGLGLFCSFLAMVVAAIVEHIRRRKAIDSGLLINPAGVVAMSAMWLIPQHVLTGVAEAFNAVAQNEFYYSQLPKSLSSFATVLGGLGLAVGNLLATFTLNTVDNLTKRGGKESWVSNNINKGHFESYYWLLAIISTFNFIYFFLCCWAYGPIESEVKDDKKDLNEEELSSVNNGVKNGEGNKEEEEV